MRFRTRYLALGALLVWGLLFIIAETGLAHNPEVLNELSAQAEQAEPEEHGHGGPVVPVLLSLVIVLFAAKVGGDIAIRLKQPEVLGELLMGMILGNLTLIGFGGLEFLSSDKTLIIMSEIGVILLLFEVGLETKVSEMVKVGPSALLVAILGVVVPFFLGWFVAGYFVPDADTLVHVFVGATLTATSVGITARVLKDMGRLSTPEAKIVLGAAVIDDVLGLMTLAVVSGIITATNSGQEMEMIGIAKIILLSFGFLGISLAIGNHVSPLCFRFATFLRSHGVLLAFSLIICFGMAYIAALVGLAPIVGAFTAGLILEPVHYQELSKKNNNAEIDQLIHPLTALFVPIFFIEMGARVDLSVFGDVSILAFALVLSVAAIIGKQVCGFGVIQKGIDKTAVGFGMIPRGEVGLIFASIGASLMLEGKPVVDASTFGAVVIMVVVTTMVTPPLITWRFKKLKA